MGGLDSCARTLPLALSALAALAPAGCAPAGDRDAPAVRSPCELAYAPDGRRLAIGDVTAGELIIVPASDARPSRRVRLGGRPGSVAWAPDGSAVYAAVTDRGELAEIDPSTGEVRRRLPAGLRPAGLAIAARRDLILVTDEAAGQVVALDRATGRIAGRVDTARSPGGLAVTPDERLAVVTHRLPDGDASDPGVSATVALIDLEAFARVADVLLPASSTNVRGLGISPDGRWAYAAHTLAKPTWPATQIEYGGISANALTVIDIEKRKRRATLLLDQTQRGCADPWGVAVSPDGRTLWTGIAGAHQIERLDLARLHAELDKRASLLAFLERANRKGPVTGGLSTARSPLMDDPAAAELVVSEKPSPIRQGIGCACGLGVFLPGILKRFDAPGLGPRGVAIAPGGRRLAVGLYFSGRVAILDAADANVVQQIEMGSQPPLDAARRGEIAFHDARLCYQQWLSCATCHPDGRADGLNWDLMNDGAGNPKNTRSLVESHRTAPLMSRGARESFETAVAAGFKHVLYREASAGTRRDVEAYLRSLRPQPSPFLAAGRLSGKAQRGKALFDDPRAGCATCHAGETRTDLKSHDVGTRADEDDDEEKAYLTPKLVELWRTAPYLHHGRAATLRDVLTTHNREDRHGRTSHLGEEEIEALAEYLKSF
jgi:DNA-binding beta-propeller fold protein YncE/cytochrome c553